MKISSWKHESHEISRIRPSATSVTKNSRRKETNRKSRKNEKKSLYLPCFSVLKFKCSIQDKKSNSGTFSLRIQGKLHISETLEALNLVIGKVGHFAALCRFFILPQLAKLYFFRCGCPPKQGQFFRSFEKPPTQNFIQSSFRQWTRRQNNLSL